MWSKVFDEDGPDPAGQSLFLLSCCSAARWGVLGTSYCLIFTVLGRMARDKLQAWQLVSEKQCLDLDLLYSAERRSSVRLCKGTFWHLESSFVVPFRAKVSISDSSNCWRPTLIPVIPITASQIQEQKGPALCIQFCRGFAKLAYFRPEKCGFFCS